MVDLDKLMDLGVGQARSVLLNTKDQMEPTWLIHRPDDKYRLVMTPWGGDFEKELARNYVRQLIEEDGADSYSVIMEAWAVSLPTGSRPILDRPSQDPRRVECVMIVATDGFNQRSKTLRIIRDKATGKCRELPEWDEVASLGGNPRETIMESPFLNLLTTLQ